MLKHLLLFQMTSTCYSYVLLEQSWTTDWWFLGSSVKHFYPKPTYICYDKREKGSERITPLYLLCAVEGSFQKQEQRKEEREDFSLKTQLSVLEATLINWETANRHWKKICNLAAIAMKHFFFYLVVQVQNHQFCKLLLSHAVCSEQSLSYENSMCVRMDTEK